MTKALLKKQMLEAFSWAYQNKKTNRRRSAKGVLGYVLLYLVVFVSLGAMFYFAADALCAPLAGAGLGWLYFAILGLIAVCMGVFGSVFNTYASLYQAKDNDLLLAMPIPSGKILLIRLSGVYIMGLLYELIVMIPTLIIWFLRARPGAAGVLFTLLIPLVLSVLVLVLSAVLGWVVALISGRLRRKNLAAVLLSLAFIAAYYYFYAHAYDMLQRLLADPQAVGGRVRGVLYPLYHMGLAAEGNVRSMLLFTAIVGLLFGAVYFVLRRSFLKLATANRGAAKARYRERPAAVRSVGQALFQKELRRFLGSANYMLNCGMGIVMMLVAAGALLWKGALVREALSAAFAGNEGTIALIAAGAVCLLSTMNDMTAPSVSLEGKTLWLAQALPVSGRQVLVAKLKLHLVLTLVPAAILTAALEWVLRPSIGFAILIPVVAALFILMMGAFGLFVNLKTPNLNWTSEIVPIKQSVGVMLCLLGGWVLVAAMAGAYSLLAGLLGPLAYMLCTGMLLLIASAVLLRWLRTKGAGILERL